MTTAHRIILNSIATYGQSLVALVLSLFSARWVLLALGVVDFGLFGVVGSIILLINFLNTAMSVGVARFYAFSIGRGHLLTQEEAVDDLKRWFNTALSIHLVLPFVLILIGWPLGEYAVQHWLTIPPERMDACIWVFRISLVMAFVTVFSVPFTSMYAAHQLISELALFGILQTVCTFIGAWFLLRIQGDRLIFYALYMMAISSGISLIQIIRAMMKFNACRPTLSYLYDRTYLKELFRFVGWKFFGASCVTLRDQGTPILTNLYFGPVINAAYSVAARLSFQASSLSVAMTGAFQPALTSVEGKGDRQGMLNMAAQVSKFGTLLILFLVIPIMLEMHNVLYLWLKEPPQYAEVLCRWLLAFLVVDKMTAGAALAVSARGKIGAYELIQGIIIFMTLPLIWLFLKFEMSPAAIGCAQFISTVIYCVGRLIFAKALVNLSLLPWFKQIALPVAGVAVVSTTAGLCVTLNLEEGFFRLFLTTAISGTLTAVMGWLILLSSMERQYCSSTIKGMIARLRPVSDRT
jgi:O-antigen/teichoic acid export membrane protein